jgi:Zn-dependent M28 family amino/carboxypeptidase
VKTLRFVLWVDLALFAATALIAACMVTQPVIPGGAEGAPPADPARLEASVRALAVRFHPRDAGHVANLDAAAAWLAAELAASGARVSEQTWVTDGDTYRNVVARLGPDSPELVVVGAHYDVCDPLPGADDDASGVAGLLELARLLGEHPPHGAVELVAYSLEEPPHFATPDMGSAHHAAALAEAGVRVRAMLSLEMLGYFSDEPNSQHYPVGPLAWLYPVRGDFIALVGNLAQGSLTRRVKRAMRAAGTIPIESINAPAWLTGIDFSDHRSYWERGFPALMVTDTSFYRNPNYHEASDTPETLDYARLARAVSAVHQAVQALASE